jgi:hypothetical protein
MHCRFNGLPIARYCLLAIKMAVFVLMIFVNPILSCYRRLGKNSQRRSPLWRIHMCGCPQHRSMACVKMNGSANWIHLLRHVGGSDQYMVMSSSTSGQLHQYDRRYWKRPVMDYRGNFNQYSFLPPTLDDHEHILFAGLFVSPSSTCWR